MLNDLVIANNYSEYEALCKRIFSVSLNACISCEIVLETAYHMFESLEERIAG